MECGAVEHELLLPATAGHMPGDRFMVTAVHGGDDTRIELRRYRLGAPAPIGAFDAAEVATVSDRGEHQLEVSKSVSTTPATRFHDVATRQTIDVPTRHVREAVGLARSPAAALALAP